MALLPPDGVSSCRQRVSTSFSFTLGSSRFGVGDKGKEQLAGFCALFSIPASRTGPLKILRHGQ
jgi:hypothetical protein